MPTAAELDAADPLACFHDRFVPAPDGLTYLDGNSLRRLPIRTPEAITRLVSHEWGERLIRGWNEGWMELPVAIGDRLGEDLLGAAARTSTSTAGPAHRPFCTCAPNTTTS